MIKKQLREKHLIKHAFLFKFFKMLKNIKYYYKYIKQNTVKCAYFSI